MQTTVPNERHRTENDHTFFDVTLWGMFDRFSSVGVEYQHTLRPTPHLRDVGWYDYPNPLASLETGIVEGESGRCVCDIGVARNTSEP